MQATTAALRALASVPLTLALLLANPVLAADKSPEQRAEQRARNTSRTVTGLITAAIADLDRFEVLSSADLRNALSLEEQKQQLGCDEADSSCLAELAGALGAELVVFGQLGKLDETYVLNLSLFDSTSTRAVARTSLRDPDLSQLSSQVPAAARELMQDIAVAEQPSSSPAAPPSSAPAAASPTAAHAPPGSAPASPTTAHTAASSTPAAVALDKPRPKVLVLDVRAEPGAFLEEAGSSAVTTFLGQAGAGVGMAMLGNAIPGLNLCWWCVMPVVSPLVQVYLGDMMSGRDVPVLWPMVWTAAAWLPCVAMPWLAGCGILTYSVYESTEILLQQGGDPGFDDALPVVLGRPSLLFGTLAIVTGTGAMVALQLVTPTVYALTEDEDDVEAAEPSPSVRQGTAAPGLRRTSGLTVPVLAY